MLFAGENDDVKMCYTHSIMKKIIENFKTTFFFFNLGTSLFLQQPVATAVCFHWWWIVVQGRSRL